MELHNVLTILSAVAACFLSWRGFVRIHSMCRCSPTLIRISAWMMATSALSIIFGALGQEPEMIEVGSTFALVSVAAHIIADKRPITRADSNAHHAERRSQPRAPAKPRRI